MVNISKKSLASAAMLLATAATANAGLMSHLVPVQTYRDFAENRGIFAAGATNVEVKNVNGEVIGVIPRMMSFEGVVDGGWSALVGGPGFIATVAHNNATSVTFGQRFGATSGTPFYDSYRFVAYNRAWGDTVNYTYDYAAPRLNKLVTEAASTNYLTDTSILNTMPGRLVLRAGGGTQAVATGNGQEYGVAGGYAFLTGGTVRFGTETVRIPNAGGSLPSNGGGVYYENQNVSSSPGSNYNSYSFIYFPAAASESNPMPIGVKGGDSGSGSWTYNENTGAFEYVGAGQSGGGSGYGSLSQMRSGNQWAQAVIDAYNSPTITPTLGGGNITWGTPNGSGQGTFTQGATSWSYVGLASNLHGSTSGIAANGTSTAHASDAQMDATRNLVFGGAGGVIELAGSIDMGAGSLTFDADYTLTNGGDASRRLNSAGFIVNEGVVVNTQLTGIAGDEWRKVGDGTLVISGTGANAADLNVGGTGLTLLDRTGGAAVRNVKINGGASTVVLVGENQISGDIVFGLRGGTLDLYGNDLSLSKITHLDDGARISNHNAGTTSTFTFTGSGSQTYLGAFDDSGSLAGGLLDVVYAPGSAGSTWKLSGVVTNAGQWHVNGGHVAVEGTPTLHAGGYIDPNDWQLAYFATGTVNVADGATFSVNKYAVVNSDINLADGATFRLNEGGVHDGAIHLGGTDATFVANVTQGTALQSKLVSGNGTFRKTGAGGMHLTHASNSFSGVKILENGTVTGASLAALGDTSVNKWQVSSKGVIGARGATVAAVKTGIASDSKGTLAILESIPTAAVDMTGHKDLFLGSIGANAIGTRDGGVGLSSWGGATGSDWQLGGGGGELTVHNTLTGAGKLVVGNGDNSGVVILTATNTFTGGIEVNAGAGLRVDSAAALGVGSDNVLVNYGGTVTLGSATEAPGVFARINTASSGVLAISGTDANAYSFAAEGLNQAALGADGVATYSGALTAGSNGYKFGGAGNLTVSSTLSGAHKLSVDGQGSNTGITTLTGTNTFTGGVTVSGGTVGGVTGAHVLKVGSADAIGSGNALTLGAGGILDVNGHDLNVANLNGAAGSGLVNAAASAATVTVNQTVDGVMNGVLAGVGQLNLVKTGAAVLTLRGNNTQSGAITVNEGTLRYQSSAAFGNASIQVNNGGSIDMDGRSVADRTVNIAGSGNGSIGALHNSATGTYSVGTLRLTDDATLTGVNTSTIYSFGSLNLAGNTLSVSNARFTAADTIISNGHIVAGSNAVLFLNGTQSGNGNGGSITLNGGSHLMIRDYNNAEVWNRKTVVLNGGTISSGLLDNGGGGQSTLFNNLVVNSSGTVTAHSSFGRDLYLAGDISGTGTLTLNGSMSIELRGGVSNFAGNLNLNTRTVFNSDANQTFSGNLAGGGAFVKNGSGTLTLAGNNTFTGNLTVNGGVVALTEGAKIYNGGWNNTSVITVNSGGTFRYHDYSYGAGQHADYAQRRVLNGGTFEVVGGTHSSGQNFTVNAAGGTFRYAPVSGDSVLTLVGNGNDNIQVNGPLTFDTNATIAVTEVLQGSGSINKTGLGQLVLSGANTYSGLTTVSQGALLAKNTAALAGYATAGRVIVNSGATLAVSTSGWTAAQIDTLKTNATFAAGARIGFDTDAGDYAYATTLGGDLGLSKLGANTMTVTGTNTFTGGVAVYGGTLVAGNASAFGTGGAYDVQGGTLDLGGHTMSASSLAVNGGTLTNGTLTAGAFTTQSGTIDASLQGTGTLVKNGAGTTVLNGANGYAGGTVVNGGTLVAGSSTAFGTGSLTAAGGVLDLGGYATVAPSVAINGGEITNGSLTASSYTATGGKSSVVLGGAASLTKTGAGTLILAKNNTYTGNTVISGGTVQVGDGGNEGTLGSGAISNSGALVFNRTGTIAVGPISGSGSLTVQGGVTVALTGSNTYTGNTRVMDGVLDMTSGAKLYNGGYNNWASITVDTAGTWRLNDFSYTGVGQLADYAARRVINGGVIEVVGGTHTSGQDFTVTQLGGTFRYAPVASGSTLTLSGNANDNIRLDGALTYDTNANIVVTEVMQGSGSVTKTGTGTLTLNANNTYSGGNTVAQGTLAANTVASLGAGTTTVANGATLQVSVGGAGQWTAADLVSLDASSGFAAGSTLAVRNDAAFTLANAITGDKRFAKTGAGTLTLTANNTNTGGAHIASGTLDLGGGTGSGSLGSGAITVDGTLALNRTGTTTLANAISGTGAITHNVGTVVMTGASDFAGTTTLNGGAFVLNSTSADSAANAYVINTGGWLTIADAFAGNTATIGSLSGTGGKIDTAYGAATATRTLSVNQTVSGNYAGTLNNAGARTLALTKTGDATLTLSGANTYSGATNVVAGTLAAGHNSAFGTSAVTVSGTGKLDSGVGRSLANSFTVNNGGALFGAATFTGAVTVNNGGTLNAGGLEGAGKLTFANGATLAAGSTLVWNFVGDAISAGLTYDTIAVTGGAFTINSGVTLRIAAIDVDYSGAFWDATRDFALVTKSGSGSINGTFTFVDVDFAGDYTAEGMWSVVTGSSGDLVMRWTAGGDTMTGFTPVPEPSTYGLMGAGSMLAVAFVRRRRKAARLAKEKAADTVA